jgi:hypothetical protein
MSKVIIEAVQYPIFITRCGKGLHINQIEGEPSIGVVLEKHNLGWKVVGKGDEICEV